MSENNHGVKMSDWQALSCSNPICRGLQSSDA